MTPEQFLVLREQIRHLDQLESEYERHLLHVALGVSKSEFPCSRANTLRGCIKHMSEAIQADFDVVKKVMEPTAK